MCLLLPAVQPFLSPFAGQPWALCRLRGSTFQSPALCPGTGASSAAGRCSRPPVPGGALQKLVGKGGVQGPLEHLSSPRPQSLGLATISDPYSTDEEVEAQSS